MASSSFSSSSLPRTWTYRVFTSFHGLDVRKAFLSHLRKQFSFNGISMFDDTRIERGETIAHELTRAIRESRISIVVLSKNYASSSWCLDELVEILKCKEDSGQIVMTVFYGVDPSDVRKQTGDFGRVFNETCARKTVEEMRKWSQALTDAGNIAGEDFENWDNEVNMIEKIAHKTEEERRKWSQALSVVASALRRMKKAEWKEKIRKLEYKPSSSTKQLVKRKKQKKGEELEEVTPTLKHESSLSNKRIGKGKNQSSTRMAFLVLINLLLEIASTVVDQLSSIHKPYFTRISLGMSFLSVVLSIIDLICKVRAHKARFLVKWPIPWFYYPSSHGYNKIGSFTDTVLLFCVVGHLVVSTINYSFMERGQDGPIKVTVWPLFFAIGMVISKFMEKPANFGDILPT